MTVKNFVYVICIAVITKWVMIAEMLGKLRFSKIRDNMGTLYADISATDAWGILSKDKSSVLIDVRTPSEWSQTGVPDLQSLGKDVVLLPWRVAPNFEFNPEFFGECEKLKLPRDTKIIFMCKAGGRSAEAAATMAQTGYSSCYNVAGGMVGEGGWLNSKLAARKQ